MKPIPQQPEPSTEAQPSPDQPGNSSMPSSVNWERAAANAQAALKEGKRLNQIARRNLSRKP